MTGPRRLSLHSASNADDLGYLGQQAVSQAARDGDFLLVGGHMVRLLCAVYPTPRVVLRSTIDADAAVENVEVARSAALNLVDHDFTKVRGNVYTLDAGTHGRVEVNLLLPRFDHNKGVKPLQVKGVGQVDSLPELGFAMNAPALELELDVALVDGRPLEYRTRIPDLEAAVVLKAHAWRERLSGKDLADLYTLLEIREAHPDIEWRLDVEDWISGFRADTARILHGLADKLTRARPGFPVPDHVDQLRLAALIVRHVNGRS